MREFEDVLLCSDFDHTMTRSGRSLPDRIDVSAIPENNIAAVKEFVAGGGTFVVVSGRNPDEIASLRSLMPIYDLFVASNGTAVYSIERDRALFSITLPLSVREVIRFFCDRADRFEYLRVTDSDFRFHYLRRGDDPARVLLGPKYPLYKAIVHFSDEKAASETFDEATARFSGLCKLEHSGALTLELCPMESGKLVALKKLIELSGRSFRRLVCVGDNENDVEMVRSADTGYAVGNAIEPLKTAARRVTVNSDEGAIAAIVNDIRNGL